VTLNTFLSGVTYHTCASTLHQSAHETWSA